MVNSYRPLFFLVSGMAAESARGGELAEFVAYHVFGDVNGDEFVAVVDSKCHADEVRGNHGSAAPGLDDVAFA